MCISSLDHNISVKLAASILLAEQVFVRRHCFLMILRKAAFGIGGYMSQVGCVLISRSSLGTRKDEQVQEMGIAWHGQLAHVQF